MVPSSSRAGCEKKTEECHAQLLLFAARSCYSAAVFRGEGSTQSKHPRRASGKTTCVSFPPLERKEK